MAGLATTAAALYAVGINETKNQLSYAETGTKDHKIFSWGSCIKGQLGIGIEKQGIPTPMLLNDLEGMDVVSVSAQGEKSAIINNFGELYYWGSVKNSSLLDA